MAPRDGLDDVARGDERVGDLERVGGDEVDLVLAGGHLVVAGSRWRCPSRLELGDDLAAHVGGEVRREIEVAAAVVRQRLVRRALDITPRVAGRTRVRARPRSGSPAASGVFEGGTAARRAGRRRSGSPVGMSTSQMRRATLPRLAMSVSPSAECQGTSARGGGVGPQVHVRLGDAGEALDGGAVEPLAGAPARRGVTRPGS